MAPEGRRLWVDHLRALKGTGERRRHPLPQLPGRDEGLVLRGGRRRDARARPRAPVRAGLDVARAPPGLPSPPPPRCCARADKGRGGGVQGARARPSLSSRCRAPRRGRRESAHGGALDGSTRHPNLARGRRRKSARAVSARAPHPGAVPISASPSLSGGSVSRAGGRDARKGRGRRG